MSDDAISESKEDQEALQCPMCGVERIGVDHWYHMGYHELGVKGYWCCFCGEDLGYRFDSSTYFRHMKTCNAYAAALLAGRFLGEYKDGRPVR